MLFRQTSSKKQLVPKVPTANEVGMKYWLVEITLTGGEIQKFYVSAETRFFAEEKAYEYMYWMTNEKLKNKLSTFRLMP
jgi:hypothetical protein